ncbi:hypothetical protein H5410_043471 [Solanum commersonii]|uniref:Uncharacterized protein n=1 Tax=Solanum commersonii TaxID=4109 RepID=A0A9J5XYJ1_SOLCO|nr:hypothetical protein H5410_043471 [Solanum commersonii]
MGDPVTILRLQQLLRRPTSTSIDSNHPYHAVHRFTGRRMKYNANVSYDYCGKQRHEEINYYRLIGYPDDFQFTNNKGSQGQIRGNVAVSMEDFEGKHNNCSDNVALNQGYSKEQYNQFIHIFKQMKMEESVDTSGGHAINANTVADTILKYIGLCFSALNSNTWIGPLIRRPQVFGEVKEELYLLQPNVKESSFNPTKEVPVMSRDVPSSSFFPFNVSSMSEFVPSGVSSICSSVVFNTYSERKKSCLDNETKGTLKNAKCFKPWNSQQQLKEKICAVHISDFRKFPYKARDKHKLGIDKE